MASISERELPDIAHHIWWQLGELKVAEEWILKTTAAKGLVSFGLEETVKQNLSLRDPRERNVHLRSSLSPYITGRKTTQRLDTKQLVTNSELFDWIVYDWGEIPEGSRAGSREKFETWNFELRNYSISDLDRFWRKDNNSMRDGVSSWSKVLAFIDHNTYPIYDSRVAIALNISLEDLGPTLIPFRFKMPGSSSPRNSKVKKELEQRWREITERKQNKYVEYNDYLRLLDAMIKRGDIRDRLEGEMHIFGVSKDWIVEFHKGLT